MDSVQLLLGAVLAVSTIFIIIVGTQLLIVLSHAKKLIKNINEAIVKNPDKIHSIGKTVQQPIVTAARLEDLMDKIKSATRKN